MQIGYKKYLISFCFIIRCTITLVLLIISILLSKDVLDQYASKATSFKQYEQDITPNESITVVLGFWPLKRMDYSESMPYQLYEQWKMEKDFNLTFGVTYYRTPQEELSLQENVDGLKINHSSIGNVKFNKLFTKWGDYYKISANLIHVKSPFRAFLHLNFHESIADEEIPTVDIRLSSEESSYGMTMNDWIDAKNIALNKVQGFRIIELQPKKVIKMKSQSKCSDLGFYNCFHSELMKQDFGDCPRRCYSISTYGNATPICKTIDEFKCSHRITQSLKDDSKCSPACTQINFETEFDYQEDLEKPDANRKITLSYKIASPKMKIEEEFLIHDFVGMLGSIGGTPWFVHRIFFLRRSIVLISAISKIVGSFCYRKFGD